MDPIQGLHHVTAMTRDAQHNVDFYRNVLGQRFVKKTVNFDVPDTYHLYFADEIGTPGSVLTFFAWPNTKRGTRGTGETISLAYNIPADSMGFWQNYLQERGVQLLPLEKRFGMDILPFEDPDGMRVELVESEAPPEIRHWEEGPIPREHALRGFHGVTLWLDELEPTTNLLTQEMGLTYVDKEGDRYRFSGAPGTLGSVVDILHQVSRPEDQPVEAFFGGGSIHHIAFRVPDDASQLEYQAELREAGLEVTPVIDRKYFHSIYYREPGGVLFEIATEPPGFAVDEPVASLGERLVLPEWFEPNRSAIEQGLPAIDLKPVEMAR
ncbi:MAG TPA: ring-cleaving dioxygenase [Anaerolineales bacterium]|nr:ring-cleaving dioxygenase [Anaerolineales bacterium]